MPSSPPSPVCEVVCPSSTVLELIPKLHSFHHELFRYLNRYAERKLEKSTVLIRRFAFSHTSATTVVHKKTCSIASQLHVSEVCTGGEGEKEKEPMPSAAWGWPRHQPARSIWPPSAWGKKSSWLRLKQPRADLARAKGR